MSAECLGHMIFYWAFCATDRATFFHRCCLLSTLRSRSYCPKSPRYQRGSPQFELFSSFSTKDAQLSQSLWILLGVSALTFLGYTSFDQSFNYYLKDVFDLATSYNGSFKGAVGLISLVATMTLGMYLVKQTDLNKSTTYIFIHLCFLYGSSLLGIRVDQLFALNLIFYGFYAISVPMVQDLITKQATPTTQGTVLGFTKLHNHLVGSSEPLSLGFYMTSMF